MSVNLQLKNIKLNTSANEKHQVKLHYIPVKTEKNCDANVEEYFDNYTDEQDKVLTNSLRGYPLTGCEFNVPQNYTGIVFQETQKPLAIENATRTFHVNSVFNKFTYWNYDKNPSKNDPIQNALQFIDLSMAMHTPISQEDLNTEMDKLK